VTQHEKTHDSQIAGDLVDIEKDVKANKEKLMFEKCNETLNAKEEELAKALEPVTDPKKQESTF